MGRKLIPLLVLTIVGAAVAGTAVAGADIEKLLFRERVLEHLQQPLTADRLDRLSKYFDEKNLYPLFVEAMEEAYGEQFREDLAPELIEALYDEFLDGFARQFASIVDTGVELAASESIIDCAMTCLQQIDCGLGVRLGEPEPLSAWAILPVMSRLSVGGGALAALGAARACNGGEVVGCSIGCGEIGRPPGGFSIDCPIGANCSIPDCDSLEQQDPGNTRWIPVGVCVGYGPGSTDIGLCCLPVGGL